MTIMRYKGRRDLKCLYFFISLLRNLTKIFLFYKEGEYFFFKYESIQFPLSPFGNFFSQYEVLMNLLYFKTKQSLMLSLD